MTERYMIVVLSQESDDAGYGFATITSSANNICNFFLTGWALSLSEPDLVKLADKVTDTSRDVPRLQTSDPGSFLRLCQIDVVYNEREERPRQLLVLTIKLSWSI